MKYLKKELLFSANNSCDEQDECNVLWNEQCQLLGEAQKKVRKKLPKELWNIIIDTGFHDAIIENININKRVKNYKPFFDIIITMRTNDNIIKLHYKEVSSFKSDLCFCNASIYFDYLYGEFLYEEGNLIHNFLAFDYCETNIICKKISIKLQDL